MSGKPYRDYDHVPTVEQHRFTYTQVPNMCLPVIQTQHSSTMEAVKAAHAFATQYYVHVILDGTKDPPTIITAEIRKL